MDIDIGIGKTGRRAWGLDDIAIVPSRRTRDPDDVDLSWEIDAYTFGLPMMASAMDGAVSPATAIAVGRLGGLAVLNLEGLWTRYEDPEPLFEEIASLSDGEATRRMQEIYGRPMDPDLIGAVIDLRLPDGDGAELAQALCERWPELPVILITGYDPEEAAAVMESSCSGRCRILTKPFKPESLVRALRELGSQPPPART